MKNGYKLEDKVKLYVSIIILIIVSVLEMNY